MSLCASLEPATKCFVRLTLTMKFIIVFFTVHLATDSATGEECIIEAAGLQGGHAMLQKRAGVVGTMHADQSLLVNDYMAQNFRYLRSLINSDGASSKRSLLEGPEPLDANASIGDLFLDSVVAMNKLDEEVPKTCSETYGAKMLNRTLANSHHLCKSSESTVLCHERSPFDVKRYMCEFQHVMISQDGVSVKGCTPHVLLEEGNTERKLFGSSSHFGGMRQTSTFDCTETIDHKVVVQMPWDMRNFYEWYGDWVTLWETLAALSWTPKDTELFLLTKSSVLYGKGFDGAWQRAFVEKGVRVGSVESLFGHGVCFKHLAIVPHGGLSTFTIDGGRSGATSRCPSTTLMASSLFLRSLYLPHVERQSNEKVVTLLLRRGKRAFELDDSAEDACRKALPHGWKLQTFRPEEMSMEQQLKVASQSQVLVGVHGAGMTFVLFLPPKARVVEVYCEDRSSANGHYRTLEGMSEVANTGDPEGVFHFSVSRSSCEVASEDVKKTIQAYEDENAPHLVDG